MARRVIRRSSFGGGRRSTRLTEWFARPFSAVEVPLAANTVLLDSSLSAVGLAKVPFTITRTVGLLSVRSDQATAIEFPFGAFGMMVVTESALAIGVTAIPDPTVQPDNDGWHVYQPWAAGGEASTNAGFPVAEYTFDSRAQRKVEEGSTLVAMIANANTDDGCSYVLSYRVLVKLS